MKIPDRHNALSSPHPVVAFLLFLCLALLIYSNVLGAPFVHDDIVMIKNNPRIGDLASLGGVFFEASRISAPVSIANTYQRPLLEAANRLIFCWAGPGPSGFHLFNIVCHGVNGFLLWLLLGRLGVSSFASWGAALLFVCHPVQSEAVACISGMSNVLCALFFLSALFVYVSALRSQATAGKGILVFVLTLAALMVKEGAVVIPLVMVLIERFFVPRQKSLAVPCRKLILGSAAAVAVFLVWRGAVTGGIATGFFSNTTELRLRIQAIPDTLLMYGRILVFPFDLHYYRSMDILRPGLGGARAGFLLALFVLLFWSVLRRKADEKQRATALFGAGWFLITLLPVLNIIPLVHEYSYIAAFEHFLYLPLAGAVLTLASLAEACVQGNRKKGLTVALAVLVAAAGLLTYRQNRFWQNETVLFERASRFEPRLGRVRLLLAKAYYGQGRYRDAEREYTQALSIMTGYRNKTRDPGAKKFYDGFVAEILFDLAQCYENLGKPARAVGSYRRALETGAADPVAVYINLGTVYLKSGDAQKAGEFFRKALQLDPANSLAATNLAACFMARRDWAAAEKILRSTLARDPQFLPAKQNLEILLREK